MEIEVFDEQSGSDLILQHVSRPSYAKEEVHTARRLARRLGGLALALVVMSSQIRLRRMTISAFLQLYEKHATKLNSETGGIESYYHLSLATCWKTAFEYLNANAKHLLGILAHVGPDALPEDLFQVSDASELPSDMKFCSDDWEYIVSTDRIRC